jgi:hypothetical protein
MNPIRSGASPKAGRSNRTAPGRWPAPRWEPVLGDRPASGYAPGMSSPPQKSSALLRWLSVLIVVVAVVVRFWPHGASTTGAPAPAAQVQPAASAPSAPTAPAQGTRAFGASVGFRSRERFEEHFRKHGREFNVATPGEYLRLAQALRDRPVGGDVLELVRGDGVVCRFDRASGTFIAFGADGIIRTCFRPNDGQRYFDRQASRSRGAP